jgi:hypothetical protein
MNIVRQPIVILDELGKLLSQNDRARCVAELADNPNASTAIIRDRLALYGVGKDVIKQIVTEFEQRRSNAKSS